MGLVQPIYRVCRSIHILISISIYPSLYTHSMGLVQPIYRVCSSIHISLYLYIYKHIHRHLRVPSALRSRPPSPQINLIYLYLYMYLYASISIYTSLPARALRLAISASIASLVAASSTSFCRATASAARRLDTKGGAWQLGLYTVLLLPILYGVWHTKGRSKGEVVYCPIAVQ